jgi:uncharacterized protein (DUF2147 family)
MTVLRRTIFVAGLLLCSALLGTQAMASELIEGVWRSSSGTEVTISPCGSRFCGYITRVVVPPEFLSRFDGLEDLAVEQYTDVNNRDPSLRNRRILGMRILTLREGRGGDIYQGEIYNPEDGRSYSGRLEVLSSNQLRLSGCVLMGTICQGENWVRLQ